MAYFANGTEAMIFEEQWCRRCVHRDHEAIGEAPPCPIWMAHFMYAYELCNEEEHPGKVMLDMLISEEWVDAPDGHKYPKQECKMFVEGDPAWLNSATTLS